MNVRTFSDDCLFVLDVLFWSGQELPTVLDEAMIPPGKPR